MPCQQSRVKFAVYEEKDFRVEPFAMGTKTRVTVGGVRLLDISHPFPVEPMSDLLLKSGCYYRTEFPSENVGLVYVYDGENFGAPKFTIRLTCPWPGMDEKPIEVRKT